MKIIAGSLGGRQFESPGTHKTHPMSSRARGALFNILGDIEGLTVLDAFAGSGALAFEAASRGAADITAVESDRIAQKSIEHTMLALNTTNIKLIKTSTNMWLDKNPNVHFDLIFCDPPYDDLQIELITRLTTLLLPDGTFVVSWPSGHEAPSLNTMREVARRAYGDAQLFFFVPR